MPGYTQPRKIWQYTKDFYLKSVKPSYQEGILVKQQVAEGLDIHPFLNLNLIDIRHTELRIYYYRQTGLKWQ